jgi:hypothetical protein
MTKIEGKQFFELIKCWIAKTLLLLFIVMSDKDEELACPQILKFFNVVISLVVLKLECCIMI